MKLLTLLYSVALSSAHSITSASDQVPLTQNDYVEINPFNYTGLGGPLAWVGLNYSANEACGKGSYQSPINIDTSSIELASRTGMSLKLPAVEAAKIENLGSGLQVSLLEGSLSVNDSVLSLKHLHFHTPSEHRVDEEYFPMECHFVFQDEDGHTTVAGFLMELFETEEALSLFDSIFSHVGAIKTPGTYTKSGPLDFTEIMHHFDNHQLYTYTGSLTTPPCTEGVPWYISTEPLPISIKQFKAVKNVLKFNARVTQNALGETNLLEIAAEQLQHKDP